MKKLLMVLLVLFSLSFAAADWQALSFIAAIAAFSILVILYMLSYLVNSSEMRIMAREEMYQVVITVFFIVLIIMFDSSANMIFTSEDITEAFGGTGGHIEFAKEITQAATDYQWEYLRKLVLDLELPLASMASSGATCSMLGSTFTYPGCIGIQVAVSSLSFAINVMSTALLANNSQLFLLKLASSFFFPVLLPLGLFLRCFQFTRGAGGFLIAIAFALYFIYPISIMLTMGMAEMGRDKLPSQDPQVPSGIAYLSQSALEELDSFEVSAECNPLDRDPGAGRKQAKRLVGSDGDDLVDPMLYYFFIEGLFTTMLNLLITLSAVRGLGAIFGSQVDVSALARIS